METNHWYAGTVLESNASAKAKRLEEMVNELGRIEFSDIAVKLFQTVIDGVVFGLVPNYEYEVVELEPSSTLSFQEPWDGEYYT